MNWYGGVETCDRLRFTCADGFDMLCLYCLQRVVPAQYAFVIHTKNPSNNDEEEVFCEMVRGLGKCG